jgi:hypothetical protein
VVGSYKPAIRFVLGFDLDAIDIEYVFVTGKIYPVPNKVFNYKSVASTGTGFLNTDFSKVLGISSNNLNKLNGAYNLLSN